MTSFTIMFVLTMTYITILDIYYHGYCHGYDVFDKSRHGYFYDKFTEKRIDLDKMFNAYLTSSGDSSTFGTEYSECSPVADIIIIMDRSIIFSNDYEQILNDVFSDVHIGKDGVRVGLLNIRYDFSGRKNIAVHLDESDSSELGIFNSGRLDDVYDINDFSEAMKVMRKVMFTPKHGERSNATNIAVLVIDNVSKNLDHEAVFKEVEAAKAAGIHIYVMPYYVEKTDFNILNRICSSPAYLHTFSVSQIRRGKKVTITNKCKGRLQVGETLCSDVDSFSCNDGHCVRYELICDGYPDCSNGADEDGCDDDVMDACKIDALLTGVNVRERRINQNSCFAMLSKTECHQKKGKQLTIGDSKMHEIAMRYLGHLSNSVSISKVELGLKLATGNQTHADYTWEDGSPLTFTAWNSPKYSKPCIYMEYSQVSHQSWVTDVSCEADPYVFCYWETPRRKTSIVSDVFVNETGNTWNNLIHFICGSAEIILKRQICDNVVDCKDGSDETNCDQIQRYKCDDGTLLNMDVWCDFQADCPDRSDEVNCVDVQCSGNEWKCKSGQCIRRENLCNHRFDCFDQSDESYTTCHGNCRKLDLFSCDRGTSSQCISRTLVTDDHNDCTNQGDEDIRDKPFCDGSENRDTPTFINLGEEGYGALRVFCISSKRLQVTPQDVIVKYDGKRNITIVSMNFGSDFLLEKVFELFGSKGRIQFVRGLMHTSSRRLTVVKDRHYNKRKTSDVGCEKRYSTSRYLDLQPSIVMDSLPLGKNAIYSGLTHEINRKEKRLATKAKVTKLPRTLVYEGRKTESEIDYRLTLRFSKRRNRTNTIVNNLLTTDTLKCKTTGRTVDARNICLLNIKPDGTPFGCRDLTHLDNCEDMACPAEYVKCVNSFCLHVQHVCDGQPHCPHGEDETGCGEYTCKGMYKCKGRSSCLTHSLVCDGFNNCPLGDDESYCDYVCPPQCRCNGSVFICNLKHLNASSMRTISPYVRYLDVSNSVSTHMNDFELRLTHLIYLNMSSCGLTTTVTNTTRLLFDHLNSLQVLDLSHNNIEHLTKSIFQRLGNLKQLYLDGNRKLAEIDDAFKPLEKLVVLSMSYCNVRNIHTHWFKRMTNLKMLNISYNTLAEHTGTLNNLKSLTIFDIRGTNAPLDKVYYNGIKYRMTLYTDSPVVCCLVNKFNKQCRCVAPRTYISSCENLISNDLLQFFIWLIGGMALLGNICVIRYRVKRRALSSHIILVTCLGFSDLLMGIYTIFIASVDVHYRGTYSYQDGQWRNSTMCKFAGILSTISSEGSALLIGLIAVDRYIAVKYPFKKMTVKMSALLAMTSLLVATIIAILPVLMDGYFKGQFYSRSAVCTALPLTSERTNGWEYSVGVFIVFNMIIFVCVGVVQFLLLREVKLSSQKTRRKQARIDIAVARSLAFVIATDFLCWFPIGVMGFMALDGIGLSHDVYPWIIVFVLPINSALNPILYTMTSIQKQRTNTGILSKGMKSNNALEIHQRLTNRRLNAASAPMPLSKLLTQTRLTPKMIKKINTDIADDLEFFHGKTFFHGHISDDSVFVDWDGKDLVGVWLEFHHKRITEKMDERKDKTDLNSLMKNLRGQCVIGSTENETKSSTAI